MMDSALKGADYRKLVSAWWRMTPFEEIKSLVDRLQLPLKRSEYQ
jgi:hypothetical protein